MFFWRFHTLIRAFASLTLAFLAVSFLPSPAQAYVTLSCKWPSGQSRGAMKVLALTELPRRPRFQRGPLPLLASI